MDLRQIQELKQDVPQYRKDFIRLVARQDAELDASLDDLNDEITTTIHKNSSGNRIQDFDKVSLLLPAMFAVFTADLLDIMGEKNEATGRIQEIAQSEIVRQKYVGISGFSQAFSSFQKSARDYVADIPDRLPYRTYPDSSYTVGSRIKTIETESVNVVRSILEVGIKRGKSANQIAKDIEQYIKPSANGLRVSPFQWVRDFLGTSRVPSGIPAGSVSFNAYRIARTEINNTFRWATVDLHKNQPWVEGYDWNLSYSHPKEDICDDYAHGSPYKHNEIPDAHPFCMCYITVRLVPAVELKL